MSETPMILLSSEVDVSNNSEIPVDYMDALIKLLISSPYMIITVALAYLSGHLWAYIILSYFSKRGSKILNSLMGKVGLGLLWFSLVLLAVDLIIYRSFITLTILKEILITVLVMSLALQATILMIINVLYRKG